MNQDIKRNNLHYYVDLLRMEGKKHDHEQSETCVTALHNVIRTMRLSRHDKICGEDFSQLDFGNIPMNGINWSEDGENPCCFDRCRLNEWNFISGHFCAVSSVAWSENGKYLISASEDKTAILWDVNSGLMLQKFITEYNILRLGFITGHDCTIYCLTYGNENIQIWDIHTGKCIIVLNTNQPYFSFIRSQINNYSICKRKHEYFLIPKGIEVPDSVLKEEEILDISPNRNYYLTMGRYYIRIRTVDDSNCKREYYCTNCSEIILAAAFLLDNSCLIIEKYCAKIWNIHTGELQTIKYFSDVSSDPCEYADISPNKCSFATYFYNRTLIWDINTKLNTISISTKTSEKNLMKRRSPYFSFSAQNNYLAIVDGGGLLSIYDIKTGTCLKSFESRVEDILSFDISFDQKYLLIGTDRGGVYLWNIHEGKCISQHKISDYTYKIAVSADKKFFLTEDGLWNLSSGENIYRLNDLTTHMLFCSDSKHYVLISKCENSSREKIYLCHIDNCDDRKLIAEVCGQIYEIYVSINGLLIANNGHDVILCNLSTSKYRHIETTDYYNRILYANISQNGHYYITVKAKDYKKTLLIKDATDNTIKYRLKKNIVAASFSSDSKYCLIQTKQLFSKSIRCFLIDIENGSAIRSFKASEIDKKEMSFEKALNLPYIVSISNESRKFVCDVWYLDFFNSKCSYEPQLLDTFYNVYSMHIKECSFRDINADKTVRKILYQYGADIEKPE